MSIGAASITAFVIEGISEALVMKEQIKVICLAAGLGVSASFMVTLYQNGGFETAIAIAKQTAVDGGFMRARQPAAGDLWGGCNDAREAGVAPLYAGEPGYRENMDGDGDGIACEPHR